MAGVVATVDIGGTDYSVYAFTSDPVDDADSYFAARLGASAWTGADSDLKGQGLVTATRMLDRRATWSGTKTSDAQALQWPRDGATCFDDPIDDGTIPDDIVYATFELALSLLEDEAVQDSPGTGTNVKKVQAGPASVEFFGPTAGTGRDFLFPQIVHELVACLMAGSAGVGPIITGLTEESSFDDEDYDLVEGYP